MNRLASCLTLLGVLATLPGCLNVTYLPHAALGQMRLKRSTRPVEDAIADPDIDPRTRRLLAEIEPIKDYGRRRGLRIRRNYERYAELDRPHVVWFVGASKPLAFRPKIYWFPPPIGSFTGVGWFNETKAERHGTRLARRGWDVEVRGVSAYSTGGWLRDPVVSSMFDDDDSAMGDLVNVVLHESVHATVLVKNQNYYNESLASFVADTMTPEYLAERFGAHSSIRATWLEQQARYLELEAAFLETYLALEALYASPRPRPAKLEQKAALLSNLQRRFDLEDTPTNATLIGAKLYGTGMAEFRTLYETCGKDWRRFLIATASPRKPDFGAAQLEAFEGIIRRLIDRDCRPLPPG